MGFFDFEIEQSRVSVNKGLRGLQASTLHRHGCNMCPLNGLAGIESPNMEADGTNTPDIYMLGPQPSKGDDKKNRHFVGKHAEILRAEIPAKWLKRMRWNHIVRNRPPEDRPASAVEIECCKPSIIKDIERTKPRAIFGFGPAVLEWVLAETHIQNWSGRMVPVKIGNHACWYFPMVHPEAVAETLKWDGFQSDMLFMFKLHFAWALEQMEKLPEPIIHTRADAVANVEWVTGKKKGDLDKVLNHLDHASKEKVVGFDYETSHLRPFILGAKILTAAVSTKKLTLAFAIDHKDAGWNEDDKRQLTRALKRFMYDAKCRKVSHQLGFELEWSIYFYGMDSAFSRWEDSYAQAYLLDERPRTHSLDVLCLQYYGLPIKTLFSALNKKAMEHEPLETILEYNGVDAKYHRWLYHDQMKRLRASGLLHVYTLHKRRTRASVLTTRRGVPVNGKVVEAFYKEHKQRADKIAARILGMDCVLKFQDRFQTKFEVSNNNHIVKVLKDVLGIKLEKTKGKKRKTRPVEGEENLATGAEFMNGLKNKFATSVIKWRKIDKLMGTYIIPVRKKDTITIDGEGHNARKRVHATQMFPDGLLHPIIATAKVRTWRTSSEDPNIQNWPKRGPNKYIRNQIEVDEDHLIVAIDYASIQARNVAMESEDRGLMKSFWERYDIHIDWLDKLLRIVPKWQPVKSIGTDLTPEKWRKEARGVVKNAFVFPAFFGSQAKSLARDLGIDLSKAEALREEFFDFFPDVHDWHKECEKDYFEKGYIQGLNGFKRRAPISLNQLINAPIQADEAVIVCGAWSRCVEYAHKVDNEDFIPNWMIHDDLTFVWKKKDLERNLEQVVPLMVKREFEWINVPIEIEVSASRKWAELEDLYMFSNNKDGGYREVKKI